MTEHKQAKFHNGELVATDEQSGSSVDTSHIEPGSGKGYRVEAKPGALEVNAALRADVEKHGNPLEFNSEHTATGPNLYGTIGEAILTATPKPHALIYFVKQYLNINDAARDQRL